jgi:hypothetical protein
LPKICQKSDRWIRPLSMGFRSDQTNLNILREMGDRGNGLALALFRDCPSCVQEQQYAANDLHQEDHADLGHAKHDLAV